MAGNVAPVSLADGIDLRRSRNKRQARLSYINAPSQDETEPARTSRLGERGEKAVQQARRREESVGSAR